jgi:16S rRNA (uracil1498-N3)-methyltransferase
VPHFYGQLDGDRVTISGADARHLARSLRARPGEVIAVVEPGRLLQVRLVQVGEDLVAGEVIGERPHDSEPGLEVTIAVALLPAPALEDIFAHCTEAGAAAFLLLATERSLPLHGAAGEAKRVRWARICREASMLAGRWRVPAIEGPVRLDDALTGRPGCLMLDRSGGPPPSGLGSGPLTLCFGPEGGWTPSELALAGRDRLVSLGPRNLRAETAALAGLVTLLGGRQDQPKI